MSAESDYWTALELIVARAQLDPQFAFNAYRILDTALLGCNDPDDKDRLLDLRFAVGKEIEWTKETV
jgi:hypothetical protein